MELRGYGAQKFGTSYYGTVEIEGLKILSVQQDTPSSIILELGGSLDFSPPIVSTSVLRPANWRLVPISVNATNSAPQFIEQLSDTSIKIYFQTKLAQRAEYQIIWNPNNANALFTTGYVEPQKSELSSDDRDNGYLNDIAFPPFQKDVQSKGLATLQIVNGDYAIVKDVKSLRQRIMNRVTTIVNTFVFLRGYGLTTVVSRLDTNDRINVLRAEISEQLLSEPEIVAVDIQITSSVIDETSLLLVQCYVTTFDQQNLDVGARIIL